MKRSPTSPPVERGYYWVKLLTYQDEWQMARLSVYPSYADWAKPVWYLIGNDGPVLVDLVTEWRGPIAPPAEVEYK